ncbi:AraC family transcriptional regulator [Paraglaciecola aquimarina]|uniref:AraC family transcriptional regulator n=1 Tax=Paraglaciecola algarum TaxID=3050085 RepID=A0ABS9D5T0_9ALTE|nr:AraC family transcriptional regulator [Paraglaciecola sp. G1-23]MCF2947378.1 AraC family transcriptional regulator [Paraglaciecola sp. G1-23]
MTDKQVIQGSEFLQSIVGFEQILAMFDLLTDVIFWIKNTDSQIIYANKKFVEHLGFHSLHQVVGKSDDSFFPPHIAKQFITDDRSAMDGKVITDRLELNMLNSGEFAWFSTSKRPLYNKQQVIVGSFGFTQLLSKASKVLSSIDAIKEPIEYVRENYGKEISIEELAKLAFISVSALERRFKKYLSKTPKQFINEVRLENARRMLIETRLPIAEIAYRCGFSEHSYFSRQFKLQFGLLPSQLRESMKS